MGADPRLMDWGGDYGEARVRGAECTSSELLAKHPQVHLHRKQLCLALQVGRAGHQMASSDDPHRRILDPLKFLNVGGGGVGEPYCREIWKSN